MLCKQIVFKYIIKHLFLVVFCEKIHDCVVLGTKLYVYFVELVPSENTH